MAKAEITRKNKMPLLAAIFPFILTLLFLQQFSYEQDLRYLTVLKGKFIVMPIVSEDRKSSFFVKAKISKEFFMSCKQLQNKNHWHARSAVNIRKGNVKDLASDISGWYM